MNHAYKDGALRRDRPLNMEMVKREDVAVLGKNNGQVTGAATGDIRQSSGGPDTSARIDGTEEKTKGAEAEDDGGEEKKKATDKQETRQKKNKATNNKSRTQKNNK